MPDPPATTLIADATELRTFYTIHTDIKSGLLNASIRSASQRLKGWLVEGAYQDALDETPTDAERAAILDFAEATLAMHFAIRGMNTNITPGGVVKTAQAERQVINSYLTPDETSKLAEGYLAQAEEIARPYMLSDGTPASEVVVTEFGE